MLGVSIVSVFHIYAPKMTVALLLIVRHVHIFIFRAGKLFHLAFKIKVFWPVCYFLIVSIFHLIHVELIKLRAIKIIFQSCRAYLGEGKEMVEKFRNVQVSVQRIRAKFS